MIHNILDTFYLLVIHSKSTLLVITAMGSQLYLRYVPSLSHVVANHLERTMILKEEKREEEEEEVIGRTRRNVQSSNSTVSF